MSRIGKKVIEIPEGVSIKKEGSLVVVKGPKGALSRVLPGEVEIIIESDNKAYIEKSSGERTADQNQGLARTLVANMVTGVSAGYEKGLEISGVGYRAEVDNSVLKLAVGYSSPVEYKVPEGITLRVDKQVNVFVTGIDKELVGKVAAEIRSIRKPEPYKGKGIRYVGEVVRKKEGKSAGK